MRDTLKASMVQVNTIPPFAKASVIYFYDPESRKLVMVGETEVSLIEGDEYFIQQANSDKHYTVSAKELHKRTSECDKLHRGRLTRLDRMASLKTRSTP